MGIRGLRMNAGLIALYKTEAPRVFEKLCAQGDCLRLRPQQRVPLPPADKVIVVRDGMLAIDAMPAKGKLQVLDFLVAGDVVSTSTILPTPRVSLRAITSASLVALENPEFYPAVPVHDYWAFLIGQCFKQMARVNIHQLMIGRLETESRVASFVLALALRNVRGDTSRITVPLPMSRVDIANYLVINSDTLSRTMMRFCDSGLIKRESRHAIQVIDLHKLKEKSPLSTLLWAIFLKHGGEQDIDAERYAERSPLLSSIQDKISAILPSAATRSLSSSSREHPYAARGAR